MSHPNRWTLVVALALAYWPPTARAQSAASTVPFTRLNTGELEIVESGVAVIRDSAAWRTLWTYFGREYRSGYDAPLPDRVAALPAVDFDHEMVLAVGQGARWGCSDRAYINRLEADGKRLRVVLGVDRLPEDQFILCMEPVSTFDAVAVPREWRQVTFVGARPGYRVPRKARWWTPPSVNAALDSADSGVKRVSWRVLARDSTLPVRDLRRLAVGLGRVPGSADAWSLLGNPRVRASAALLTILGSGNSEVAGRARELLFERHGHAIAGDPRADTVSLRIVIGALHLDGDHPDVARLLTGNRAVRASDALLRALIRQVRGDSVACRTALTVYASRWPLQHDLPTLGPGRAYESIECASPRDLGLEPQTRELPNVRFIHLCGTTFRLRNSLSVAAEVSWDVPGTGETGHVTAPPRGRRAYSELLLTTRNRGTLRLYRDGNMIQIIGNKRAGSCEPRDTIPPAARVARLFFPADTAQWVVEPTDGALRYYRALVRAVFYDTTGGTEVRSDIARWRAEIVAGGPYPSGYILRLPDPGPSWSAFDSLLTRIRGEPAVQEVFPLALWR